jgi:hypothetical protein
MNNTDELSRSARHCRWVVFLVVMCIVLVFSFAYACFLILLQRHSSAQNHSESEHVLIEEVTHPKQNVPTIIGTYELSDALVSYHHAGIEFRELSISAESLSFAGVEKVSGAMDLLEKRIQQFSCTSTLDFERLERDQVRSFVASAVIVEDCNGHLTSERQFSGDTQETLTTVFENYCIQYECQVDDVVLDVQSGNAESVVAVLNIRQIGNILRRLEERGVHVLSVAASTDKFLNGDDDIFAECDLCTNDENSDVTPYTSLYVRIILDKTSSE